MRIFPFAAVVLCVLAFTVSAPAAVEQGDLIKFGNGPGSPGGLFRIDDLNDAGQWNFDTFCVELEEHINFSSTYAVEAIALSTNQTGRNLTSQTAWLYNSFLNQTLSGIDYNSITAFVANTLQYAIWRGMGYTSGDVAAVTGNSWVNTYDDAYTNDTTWDDEFSDDVTDGSWSGTGDIYVMNLRKVNSSGDYTSYAQDQLVRLPSQGPVPNVPEPLSLLVWSGLGVVGLATSRFRKNK